MLDGEPMDTFKEMLKVTNIQWLCAWKRLEGNKLLNEEFQLYELTFCSRSFLVYTEKGKLWLHIVRQPESELTTP